MAWRTSADKRVGNWLGRKVSDMFEGQYGWHSPQVPQNSWFLLVVSSFITTWPRAFRPELRPSSDRGTGKDPIDEEPEIIKVIWVPKMRTLMSDWMFHGKLTSENWHRKALYLSEKATVKATAPAPKPQGIFATKSLTDHLMSFQQSWILNYVIGCNGYIAGIVLHSHQNRYLYVFKCIVYIYMYMSFRQSW